MVRGVRLAWAAVAVLAATAVAPAAEVSILLPQQRNVFQTNERIDVSVVRESGEPLSAGNLVLTLAGEDGSKLSFTLAVGAAQVVEKPVPPPKAPPKAVPGKTQPGATSAVRSARRTEHLHLNGRLLRPGKYALEVACDGATAGMRIEIFSHVRKTSFRIIDWGGSGKGAEQVYAGEEGTGINLMQGAYGGLDVSGNIRGGMDYMRNCAMGGGHQMDLRLECDWSDPYVLAGGSARAARQALADRKNPNTLGVHFYDEPGLTWNKHPKTGLFSPHNIAGQDWAWKAAFDADALQYCDVNAKDPAQYAAWERWIRWKQVFMEAAWRNARFAVEYVNPSLLSTTQSMYAWLAFGDGYYFNVVRSLPVIEGHGGYDDYAGGYLSPGFFFEFGRIRELHKPAWYLPLWWDGVPSPNHRLEQYLTFMMGAQGLAVTPGIRCEATGLSVQDAGVVESHRLMAKLGTIFTTMPVTRPRVAMLYSMSQNVKAMTDSNDFTNGQDFAGQVERLLLVYVAAKMAHIPVQPVVEEDVLDGTVAANHKVVILTGIEVLEPRVVEALKGFAAGGGKVLLTDECKVQIPGAVKLGAEAHTRLYQEAAKAFSGDPSMTRQMRGCTTRGPAAYFREAAPIAKALTARCAEAGIAPIVDCGNSQVLASNHAYGDVEYLFLVNATSDEEGTKDLTWNAIRPAEARVSLPDDGRPVYDAVHGGEAGAFSKDKGRLAGTIAFGPGQLRAYARTARPIGGVQVLAAVPSADYTLEANPVRLELQAFVKDAAGGVLNGSIPLSVQVTDALGATRYDLYRATERGVLKLDLALAVNDAPGDWTVTVKELLSGKEGAASFKPPSPSQAGAVAGAEPRAVYFAGDYDPIFRFFRVHKNVALVTGAGEWNQVQAQRLAGNLKRWGVECRIIPAAELKKKVRADDVKKTWAGAVGNADLDIPAEAAVLLGEPDDNPAIKSLMPDHNGFTPLPYVPAKDAFPGRGRGMVAWQTDCLGFHNFESIALIAEDAEGMAQAAGTLLEIVAGYKPSTPWVMPSSSSLAPASARPQLPPQPGLAAQTVLTDRVLAMKSLTDGGLLLLVQDGTLTRLDKSGKELWRKSLPVGASWRMDASTDGSLIAVSAYGRLAGLNAKGDTVFEVPLRYFDPRFPKDVCNRPISVNALAVAPDGARVAILGGRGIVMLVSAKGEVISSGAGVTLAEFDVWKKAADEWQARKEARDAAKKAYKAAQEAYKAAMAEWSKAPAGKRGPEPAKPVAPPPDPQPTYPQRDDFFSVAYSADGKTLLALTGKGGRLLSADGREIAALSGVIGGFGLAAPVAVGDAFLASNAKDAVLRFSASDGNAMGKVVVPDLRDPNTKPKPPAPRDLPEGPIVDLKSVDGAVFVMNHQEGRVRRVNPDGQVAWLNSAPGTLSKSVAIDKDRLAAGYWGGLVRVIDAASGQTLAARRFDQDVAAIAWHDGKLLVGLADGRLITLDRP